MMGITAPTPVTIARALWRGCGAKSYHVRAGYDRVFSEWMELRAGEHGAAVPQLDSSAVAIIPPDPMMLSASKGDQAVISVLTTHLRASIDDPRITMATCSDRADRLARDEFRAASAQVLGKKPLRAAAEELLAGRPQWLFLIGADVLDGSYDPRFSLRLLALTDLAARAGVNCVVTGFSFSGEPYPALARAFAAMHESVRFCVRDPVSLERFEDFSGVQATGVADMAFLLEPDNDALRSMPAQEWIDDRRSSGRRIIGLNMHPLLFPRVGRTFDGSDVVGQVVDVMSRLIRTDNVSLMLIAHDFRGASADRHLLEPLNKHLAAIAGSDVYHLAGEHTAGELKAVAGRLDGVISGRMHLAVAALGSGTPVIGLNYKDKMDGLFRHFGLEDQYLLSFDDLTTPGTLQRATSAFLANLPDLKTRVTARVEDVRALSRLNLLGSLQAGGGSS